MPIFLNVTTDIIMVKKFKILQHYVTSKSVTIDA